MYRALLTVFALFTVSVGFTQSTEVRFCSDCKTEPIRSAALSRILIKAKCAFADGTIVTEQLIEVDARASAQEKRAAAERVCEPIMAAASARCDDLATRVDALRSESRIAAPYSSRAREVAIAIKQAGASAPQYCK
jgi:hypothetical protein